MKNTIFKFSALLAAVVLSASCIQESVPVGGSVTQAQVSASDFALMSMINAMPASMSASGTGGYAGSYGDHTDFGIPGIHLRTEHILEDIATMADFCGNRWQVNAIMMPTPVAILATAAVSFALSSFISIAVRKIPKIP